MSVHFAFDFICLVLDAFKRATLRCAGTQLTYARYTLRCLLVSTTMTLHVFLRHRATPSLSALFSQAFPTTGIIIDTFAVARLTGYTGQPSGARWLNILAIVMLLIWLLGYFAGLAGIGYKVWKGEFLWEGKDDVSSLLRLTVCLLQYHLRIILMLD